MLNLQSVIAAIEMTGRDRPIFVIRNNLADGRFEAITVIVVLTANDSRRLEADLRCEHVTGSNRPSRDIRTPNLIA